MIISLLIKAGFFLEAHLRHNRRLIAKIPLLNNQSHKSDMNYSSVFPDNLVHVSGKIEKPLTPGDYEIRFVGKFNGIRLRGFNHKLSINKSGQSVVEDKPTETANNRLKKES